MGEDVSEAMGESTMRVIPFVVGPLQENCYLLADEQAGEAVLIDPGAEGERLLEAVEAAGLRLTAIWLTHAHFDHVGGLAAIRRRAPAPIWLHPADRPLYDRAVEAAAAYGLPAEAPPPPDHALAEGDRLSVGALGFDVLHAPGHAPGHVCLVGHGVAFVGDCLFAGSVGRTDLPLSDPHALHDTLQRLAALPPETVVYSGHGPATTIARELRSNPFLNGAARVRPG